MPSYAKKYLEEIITINFNNQNLAKKRERIKKKVSIYQRLKLILNNETLLYYYKELIIHICKFQILLGFRKTQLIQFKEKLFQNKIFLKKIQEEKKN